MPERTEAEPDVIEVAEEGGRFVPPQPPEIDANEPEDVEMDFFGHLDELRRRLLRAIVWATVGMSVGWYLTPAIMYLITRPTAGKLEFVWKNLYDPFMLYVKVSLIGGLIIFAPLIIYEIWAFVAPAMTRREKNFVRLSLPGAVLLFFSGVAMCYFCIPLFLGFFLTFFGVAGKSTPTIDYAAFVSFIMLCFLAFGACFQFPLIVIFLAKLGVVDYPFLCKYRRHAYFIIVVIASIATPTWDPFTLLLCSMPVCVLYEGSIWIVRFFVKPL